MGRARVEASNGVDYRDSYSFRNSGLRWEYGISTSRARTLTFATHRPVGSCSSLQLPNPDSADSK